MCYIYNITINPYTINIVLALVYLNTFQVQNQAREDALNRYYSKKYIYEGEGVEYIFPKEYPDYDNYKCIVFRRVSNTQEARDLRLPW